MGFEKEKLRQKQQLCKFTYLITILLKNSLLTTALFGHLLFVLGKPAWYLMRI
jgi:hypothetical protein